MKGLIYLAGPMQGFPEFNFPAFAATAAALRMAGYDILSPHELDLENGFDPKVVRTVTREQVQGFLRRDMLALARCQSIALMPGWRLSKGANLELAVAERIGCQVYEVTDTYDLVPLRPAAVGVHIELRVL